MIYIAFIAMMVCLNVSGADVLQPVLIVGSKEVLDEVTRLWFWVGSVLSTGIFAYYLGRSDVRA